MKYLLVLLLSLAAACAQLGLPTPQTFNEKMATAYVTVTAVRDTATKLLVAKKLSADDAQNVLNQTDNARAGLDIARKLADVDAANAKLASVQAALVALNAYLASKK
jgi:hypothetical protein